MSDLESVLKKNNKSENKNKTASFSSFTEWEQEIFISKYHLKLMWYSHKQNLNKLYWQMKLIHRALQASRELLNDNDDANSDASTDSDHMKLDMFDEIWYLNTDGMTPKHEHLKFIIIILTEESVKMFSE